MKNILIKCVLVTTLCPVLLRADDEPEPQDTEQVLPRQGLLLANVAGFRRAGIDRYDPLEAWLVRRGWAALQPEENKNVDLGDGEQRKWTAVELDENGAIDRQSLGRGAYAYIPIEVDSERVMILNAASHGGLLLNGIPHASNMYGYDYYHVPVRLKAGQNGLLLRAGRKGIKVRLYEPPASAFLLGGDATLPDLVMDRPIDTWGAVIVVNSTDCALRDLSLASDGEDLNRVITKLPSVPPMSIRKVGFRLQGPAAKVADAAAPLQLELYSGTDSTPVHTLSLELRRRSARDAHKRTFVSRLDGSVQYYGLRPAVPLSDKDPPPALVLSCHGASVEGIGQAASYSSKSWLHLVAPTNRRPYGFDWEDLGRADAIEVLQLAQRDLTHDPARVYLTGHSMGGHGTWHLASLFPDRFAAIGPSAGWISYTSYARGPDQGDGEPSEIQELLRRGRIIGDPVQLSANLKQQSIYILHGGADDNVPADQARRMAELLTGMHRDWVYHEEPGKGHWWSNELDDGGATCMDWPEMYDCFARHALPPKHSVRTVEFATANPGVSGSCHWLGIEAQLRHHEVSRAQVQTWPNRRRFQGTTENVAMLRLEVRHLTSPGPVSVELDGQKLADLPYPSEDKQIWLRRDGHDWHVIASPDPCSKSSHRYGSVKNELRHRFMFVYGTGGTGQENVWTYAKARLDAETLWYRGNASVDVIADHEFSAESQPDRTVILYGNADLNSAWSELLGDSPVQVRNGEIQAGSHRVSGDDLACLFVQPRRDSDVASVIAVAATGLTGIRLSWKQSLFQPFVRYPDCVALRAPAAGSNTADVEFAGYFGLNWSVDGGEFVFNGLDEP